MTVTVTQGEASISHGIIKAWLKVKLAQERTSLPNFPVFFCLPLRGQIQKATTCGSQHSWTIKPKVAFAVQSLQRITSLLLIIQFIFSTYKLSLSFTKKKKKSSLSLCCCQLYFLNQKSIFLDIFLSKAPSVYSWFLSLSSFLAFSLFLKLPIRRNFCGEDMQ